MAPMLVFGPDGTLFAAVGSPAAAASSAIVAQALVALIDWGMNMQEAVDLPHILNRNGATELEAGTAAEGLAPALAAMGHAVKIVPLESGLEGIRIVDKVMDGGVDPRREGSVMTRPRRGGRAGSGGFALTAPTGPQLGNSVRYRNVEHRPARRLGNQPDVAAMGSHQLAGDGEAKAGAAGPRRRAKGLEQMLARALRHAWTVVANLDHDDAALAPAGDPDHPVGGRRRDGRVFLGVECFCRISDKVHENPEQLVAVGVDHDLGGTSL